MTRAGFSMRNQDAGMHDFIYRMLRLWLNPLGLLQPPTLMLENEITTRPLVGSPKLVAGRN